MFYALGVSMLYFTMKMLETERHHGSSRTAVVLKKKNSSYESVAENPTCLLSPPVVLALLLCLGAKTLVDQMALCPSCSAFHKVK